MGPDLSGLLSPFPVFACVMAIFSQRNGGSGRYLSFAPRRHPPFLRLRVLFRCSPGPGATIEPRVRPYPSDIRRAFGEWILVGCAPP
jgi:hypothetical protein